MNQPEDAATDAAILLDDVHLKLTSAAGEGNILRGIALTGRRQIDNDDGHRRSGENYVGPGMHRGR